MNYYIDITLLSSDGIGIHFLWSKVMMQTHLALVEIQNSEARVPIAVSFPNYREKQQEKPAFIGNKLRLMAGEKADLESLHIEKWLNRLMDYVHIKSISAIDIDKIQGYESFGRRRKPGNVEYMIRRRMKYANESYDQAKAHFKGFETDKSFMQLPFIRLNSLSSDHPLTLAIQRRSMEVSNDAYSFNTYGLNSKSALPKF